MKATIGKKRKDGKYKVYFSYSGGPNGFGGSYPGRTINKIMAEADIRASMKASPDAYPAYQLKQWGIEETSNA